MTNVEAIETLRANYPDACFEQLREAADTAIEALKAQDATGDTISRQAAIDKFEPWLKVKGYNEGELNMLKAVLYELKFLPSAQPERKTGMWIKNEDRHSWHCSACMEDNFYAYSWNSETGIEEFQDRYCPCCGAKMEA